VPIYLQNRNWLTEVGRNGKGPRQPVFLINNVLGLLRACQRGLGIALLPDYLIEDNAGLVQLFGEEEGPALDAFFVYPEELKSVCTRSGVPRLPRQQRAALELLSATADRVLTNA
jgi:DNA-binding transcriptional LysR family regulator